MKNARPVLWGIIIVLAIIIFILGAVLLSVVEARINTKPPAVPATATATATLPVMSPVPVLPSPTPLSPTPTVPAAPIASDTQMALPTLPILPSVTPGYQASATAVSCGTPYGWVTYIVQAGDTLYRLSLAYDITVTRLQQANCMGTSTLLTTGQTLFVPPGAPETPIYFTPVVIPTSTIPPLPTSLP